MTRIKARIVSRRDRARVLERLAGAPEINLFLIDLVKRLGEPPAPGESAPHLVAAYRGDELCGVASMRPSVALDAELDDEVLSALMPTLRGVESGLVKSPYAQVSRLWDDLRARGRRALIDREETAYRLSRSPLPIDEGEGEGKARPARHADLDALVFAARASLREENRPDPCAADPVGFRRWVEGRLARARVVETDGRLAFVGYADVRRPEGWLVQGVYTWPDMRRRGFARQGMLAIAREGFAAGADHVQLAVVAGNAPATALYEGLGFEPFARLRTVLFQ